MGKLGLTLTALGFTVVAAIIVYALYTVTPSVLTLNASLIQALFTSPSPSLVRILSYVATALEYLFLYYIFRKVMGYISNELKDDVDLLVVKAGESPLPNRFARRLQKEVPGSAKLLWYVVGWRYRRVAVAVIDRKPMRFRKMMFRRWWIPMEEGGERIGGGTLTANMLKANNWSLFLKRKVSGAKHVVVIGGLGGSHGSAVLASPSTRDLMGRMGCKCSSFIIFSNAAILEMKEKSENLRKWQTFIKRDIECPLYERHSLKVVYDFESKEEEEEATNDAVEFLTALCLHYTKISGTSGDDFINIILNLSSRVVTPVWIRNLSKNPEVLAQEIPHRFKLLEEKIHLHPTSSQIDLHIPPSTISSSFGTESASIFRNPSDSEEAVEARESDLGKALDGLKQQNKLRMSVQMNVFETPDVCLLIPLCKSSLTNGLWWCQAFPEHILRKLTSEEEGLEKEVKQV